jgi:hypothetical protein
MRITGSKAPEGRNIGNKTDPSVFLAPEGRNIGSKSQQTMKLRPSGAVKVF